MLALKGSYHGDTLGAMEAQAPSSYTGFLQQPWYVFIYLSYLEAYFKATLNSILEVLTFRADVTN